MQQLETSFQNDISKIAIDRAHNLISNTWLRQVTHEEMVLTAKKLNQLLQEHKADKLLLSALQMGSLSPETKEWLSTSYYKSLSDLGLKKLARVLPQNLFNKLSFEAVVTRAEALGAINFEVRNFTSDEAALRWLRD
jgi:Anaphase-promoting complex, cyclosome, subunit 4